MLCVEDVLDALRWAEEIGGLKTLIDRSTANLEAVEDWAVKTDWIDFLANDPATRSNTSICLSLSDRCPLEGEARATAPKRIAALLGKEGVAQDINGYRDAPPGLRIWGGATVDPEDTAALMPWIDWAYQQIAQEA